MSAPLGGFADHFSGHAPIYATYRPRYPAALYGWLAKVAPGTQLAWDVGTGNGQVAQGLVTRFARVVATDPSEQQLALATQHARIRYACTMYEAPIDDATVDLVTVGQALHWFDLPAFFAQLRRVLRPGGLLAAFAYGRSSVEPAVDAVVRQYHDEVLGPYWAPEHALILDGYRGLELPIDELEAPAFEIVERWSLARYQGFLRSWSSVQRLLADGGEASVESFERALAAAWGPPHERAVRWPLVLRAGSPL